MGGGRGGSGGRGGGRLGGRRLGGRRLGGRGEGQTGPTTMTKESCRLLPCYSLLLPLCTTDAAVPTSAGPACAKHATASCYQPLPGLL